jgi:hypothetical protein
VLLQIPDQLLIPSPALVLAYGALEESCGNDLAAAQGNETLDDEGNGDDRCQQKGPDGPAGSLNDGEHVGFPAK